MRLALACTLMLLAGTASAAEAWRWVDKNGVVHYGDQPRQDARFLEVKPHSGNGPDAAMLAMAAECQRQKAELDGYRRASSLRQVDALGNVHTFTEQERLKLLEVTEKKVKDTCSGGPPAPPAPNTEAP